jgi:hypothetical protein
VLKLLLLGPRLRVSKLLRLARPGPPAVQAEPDMWTTPAADMVKQIAAAHTPPQEKN